MRRVAVIGVGVDQVRQARSHRAPSSSRRPRATPSWMPRSSPAPIQALYFGNVTGGERAPAAHGPARRHSPGPAHHPDHPLRERVRDEPRRIPARGDGDRRGRVRRGARGRGRAHPARAHRARHRVLRLLLGRRRTSSPLASPSPGSSPSSPAPTWTNTAPPRSRWPTWRSRTTATALLNPKAQFRKEITLDTVLKSAYVADPLKLFDCCPFTDGGAAVILASEEVAPSAPAAIWVLGTHAASDTMFMHEKRDLSRVAATERAAARRLPAGGRGPRRRGRGRAPRLLHHRRDRGHRGPGLLRAGHRRRGRREGLDQHRREDPGQSLGRAQVQGPSRSAPPAPPRSPRSSPSCAARRGRGRSRAPGPGSLTPWAAIPPPCS